MSRIPFKQHEKDFIYLAYPEFDNADIAKTINRTKEVIKAYANLKNIRKPHVEKVKVGDVFGYLEVKAEIDKKNRNRMWKCVCRCGSIIEISTGRLYARGTKSCGCLRLEVITDSYGDITGTWYGTFQKNAKVRGFVFNLSKEYLQNLLDEQDYKCALSGLPIKIERCRSGKKYYSNTTASLDRIDNTLGYEEGNVQFLHKHVNMMKWTHDQNYFLELCKKITLCSQ